MATAPFSIAETTPGNTDAVSVFPAAERTFRDVVESALAVEHDMGNASTDKTARHKFGVGSTGTRDTITTWVVGGLWFNTGTTPATLQLVTAVGPVTWQDITSSSSGSGSSVTGDTVPRIPGLSPLMGPLMLSLLRGTSGQALLSAGSGKIPAFGNVVRSVDSQEFTANGTYTPTSGMLYCIVIATGAGGGGGGADGDNGAAGGGGGAGETAISVLTAATIGASKAVAIGAAGAAGSSAGGSGGTGGNTTLGSTVVVANGGAGGAGDSSNSGAVGADGGASGTGDHLIDGGNGGGGVGGSGDGASGATGLGGMGGASFWGGGAAGAKNAAGAAGQAYGSGGGGAQTASSTNRAGGPGKAGYMLIFELIA